MRTQSLPTILCTLALVLLLTPASSLAAPDSNQGPPASLTLEDVLRVAREHNRDIKATREHLNQSAADVQRAWAPLLPTVNLQGKYTHNNVEISVALATQSSILSSLLLSDVLPGVVASQPTNTKAQTDAAALLSYCSSNPDQCAVPTQAPPPAVIQKQEQLDLNLSATIPLIVPYAYPALKGAKEAYKAQEKTAAATETQLLVQVAASFYTAAGSDELVAARQHAVEVAQKTLTDAEARLTAGTVNRVDVLRAKTSVTSAEQALREQVASTASAYRSLRTLAQIEGPFVVVAPGDPATVDRDSASVVRSALGVRAEILALDRNIIAADANKLSYRLRWAPSLSAFGLGRVFNYGGFNNQNYAWAVGAQLDWLLYDGGVRQAFEKQFASSALEAKLRREQLRDQIADEVRDNLANLEVKRQGLIAARAVVQLAKDTLEIVRAQREAGTATQLELRTAQDQLVQSEVTVARLRFDLGLTEVQLERAAGTFH